MPDDMEDPLVRISQRCIEILQEETQGWMRGLVRDALSPDGLARLIRSAGIDTSQLSGMAGHQAGLDPHRILGLDRSASDEEVRHRYRALLYRLHPDTAGIEGTETLLQLVMAAYSQIVKERGWK